MNFTRCPSITDWLRSNPEGYQCIFPIGHRGLCCGEDRNRGPWEDRYRVGYRPELDEGDRELLADMRELVPDLEKAMNALRQAHGHDTRLVRKLRVHVERIEAELAAEALR